MARMNPKRWLLVIAFSATMYVAVVATAALGGIWSVPQQLHSLILVSLAVAAIIAARAASAACSDRLASAERADHAAALGRQLDAIRREMPTPQLRPGVGAAPVLVPVGAQFDVAEVLQLRDRIARRLADAETD